MSDITKMLSRDKSTITTLIAKIEKNGYIKKIHCFEDKRVFYIILTNKIINNLFIKTSCTFYKTIIFTENPKIYI